MWSIVVAKLIAARTRLLIQTHSLTRLSYKEAFYLATRGGAQALSLERELGAIAVGMHFDALVINANAVDSVVDVFDGQQLAVCVCAEEVVLVRC